MDTKKKPAGDGMKRGSQIGLRHWTEFYRPPDMKTAPRGGEAEKVNQDCGYGDKCTPASHVKQRRAA